MNKVAGVYELIKIIFPKKHRVYKQVIKISHFYV
jgi:hypothetical protein